MNNHDLLISIKDTTEATAKDLCELKAIVAKHETDIDALKLANARLQGQIDMLWKLGSILGIPGIVALFKAFW